MDISVTTNSSAADASVEERLQAALIDAGFFQTELDRTYQALEQIERERAEQDHDSSRVQTQLDDVRLQLSEVAAIGAARRAVQRDTATVLAQIGALQEQHLEMQQWMIAMRRQWFAGKAPAESGPEPILELRDRMAALKRQWVIREITSAAARQATEGDQPERAELTLPATPEAAVCLA